MKFKQLEIIELLPAEGLLPEREETSHYFDNVTVTYTDGAAIAYDAAGQVVARMRTFADDPVSISDFIKIEGVLEVPTPGSKNALGNAFGDWVLSPHRSPE